MANPIVAAIEALGVNTVQLAHAERRVRLGCLDQEMIMIGHETVRMADPAEPRDDVRESIEKQFAVSVREKDLLARVARLVR